MTIIGKREALRAVRAEFEALHPERKDFLAARKIFRGAVREILTFSLSIPSAKSGPDRWRGVMVETAADALADSLFNAGRGDKPGSGDEG